MMSPWQYALTVGPLGVYLWVLALWQSERHPCVVRGLVDFTMLAFGVGGVLAFGPFGLLVARMLFGRPDAFDRLAVVSGLGLIATLLARRSLHRFVVYRIDRPSLDAGLVDVLNQVGGPFVRTLSGFEDRTLARGIRVEFSPRLGCAEVIAYGLDPEGLIQEIRPRLRERLREVVSPPSSVALWLYGGSILVTLAPLIGLILTQPGARETFRVLIERLRGS